MPGAPRLAGFETWEAEFLSCTDSGAGPSFHPQYLPVVHPYGTTLAECVGAIAAPSPQLGRRNEKPFDRIPVHVTELFDALASAPYIEVVKARLPHVLWRFLERNRLRPPAATLLLRQDAACKAEFQSLHDNRGSTVLWLADEKMKMLGHDHVSDDDELVSLTDLFEDLEKKITPDGAAEQRLTLITTTSDEVKVSGTVVTGETPSHGKKVDWIWRGSQ
jgi:hypothetical protein